MLGPLSSPGVLPEDLRRQLSMEAPDLAQTIQQHVRAGGWKRSTPLRLPNEGYLDCLKWMFCCLANDFSWNPFDYLFW